MAVDFFVLSTILSWQHEEGSCAGGVCMLDRYYQHISCKPTVQHKAQAMFPRSDSAKPQDGNALGIFAGPRSPTSLPYVFQQPISLSDRE